MKDSKATTNQSAEMQYDALPEDVKNILSTLNEDLDQYEECTRITKELNSIGWTCSFGLDGVIDNVYKS